MNPGSGRASAEGMLVGGPFWRGQRSATSDQRPAISDQGKIECVYPASVSVPFFFLLTDYHPVLAAV